MKKFLLTGLGAEATEAGIRSWLSEFGSVLSVNFVRDGDTNTPVAIIEMDITDGQAYFIQTRISSYWHDGSLVSAHLLGH